MAGSAFGIADYAVCGLMVLISAGIGMYYRFTGGRQKTTDEYLLADRNMSAVPVAFSLMASFLSAVSLLGLSAESYTYGTMFMVANISYGMVTPLVTNLYLPVFYKLGATSAFEYLERRFGVTSRLVASLTFSLQMILYMGVVLYAPALALEAVTGLPKTWSILCVGLVCTFYSTIGGLKAVLITDVFQSLLMFAGVFSVIFSAWRDKGSVLEIWRIANEHGRIDFSNASTDPTARHTWWSLIIGGGITHLAVGVNQAQVQRYLSVKDIATARRAIWLGWPLLSLMSLSTSFAGLAIFSRYASCDPLSTGKISSQDQLMPFYVLDTMSGMPGLAGLFLAGIFSAALSTVSSAVNSLAAVSLEDYIKPIYKRIYKEDFPENGSSYKAKIISVLYGLVSIAMAFLAQCLGSVLQASLTILGAVGGPLLALFSLGMFFPSANETGALSGLMVSLTFSLWLGFSPKPAPSKLPLSTDGCVNNITTAAIQELTAKGTVLLREDQYFYLFRISYLWLSVLSVVICVVVGYIVSILARHILHLHSDQSDSMDPDLFVPPIASYLKKQRGHFSLDMKGNVEQVQCNKLRKLSREGDQDTLNCEEVRMLQSPL